MVPISNTGPVPKLWPGMGILYVQSPIFPYGGTFYKKVLLLHDIWLLQAET